MQAPGALVRLLWAAPCSLLGLILAMPICLGRVHAAHVAGVLELVPARPRPALFGGFVAITFGHVVIAASRACHAAVRRHERVHVRQYERWGPLFLLVYPLASLVAWLRGGHPYRDNRFEREARALADPPPACRG